MLGESRVGRAVRGKAMELRRMRMGVRLKRSNLTTRVLFWLLSGIS